MPIQNLLGANTLKDLGRKVIYLLIAMALLSVWALPAAAVDAEIETDSVPNPNLGDPYSFQFEADAGTPPLTWTVIGGSLPPGLSLSTGGLLSGTPIVPGPYQATIKLEDSLATSDQRLFNIFVDGEAVNITTNSLVSGKKGDPYASSINSSGGIPGYTFSIIGGSLPAGISLAGNGALSGTPTVDGTFPFTAKVVDSVGEQDTKALSLTIAPPDLVFVTTSIPDATVADVISQSLIASGGTPPYSWSITAGALPTGVSLSGGGQLSGSPTSAGLFSFTVKLADSGSQQLTRGFNVTIDPYDLEAVAGALANGEVGLAYSDSVNATGGQLPYGWSIVGGSLPPGLTLQNNGDITGTPSQQGTFPFTARVTDGKSQTDDQNYTIEIEDGDPLNLPTTVYPTGMIGEVYVTDLIAAGGTPPYTWRFPSNPNVGLELAPDGQLSGMPTAAGSLALPVEVTDGNGVQILGQVIISIIAGSGTDLVVSDPLLEFAAAQGGSNPSAKTVSVSTTVYPVNFTVMKSDAAWLSISPLAATTPSIASVEVDQGILPVGTYEGLITFESQLTGEIKETVVRMVVSDVSPSIAVQPPVVQYTVQPTDEPTVERQIELVNPGGGSVDYQIRVLSGQSWISVPTAVGSVGPDVTQTVDLTLDRRGISPGFRRGAIEVLWDDGSVEIPVVLFWAEQNLMDISPEGLLFEAVVGNPPFSSPPPIQILSQAASLQNWSVEQDGGEEWLELTALAGQASLSEPGELPFTIHSEELPIGIYYASLTVSVEGSLNGPFEVPIILNVVTPDLPSVLLPDPAGLLFISRPGQPIAPQQVKLLARTAGEIPFTASILFNDGEGWLTMSPESSGVTSLASPATISLAARAGELAPGIYRALVSVSSDSAFVRGINVTLIVTGADPAPEAVSSIGAPRRAEAGCTAKSLVATDVGLPFSFTSPASWPVPLRILLKDSCGNSAANGRITATFSNGDPAVAMKLLDATEGIYAATWVPASVADSVAVRYSATAAGLESSSTQTLGAVLPKSVPALADNGILHNLNPVLGAPLAPGNIVAIFGENMAASTAASDSLPLPTSVGGTSVLIGGLEAPLYFVSPKQINAMVPFELEPGRPYQVIVSANNALTLPESVQIQPVQPGIAALPGGVVIAQHSDGSLVTADNPAEPGEFLVIYLAGMGRTDVDVPSGEASPANPLARPLAAPTLTIGGEEADIFFAGLTPGLVGLYQINFPVPANAPSGMQQLVVSQDGVASNVTTIAIK